MYNDRNFFEGDYVRKYLLLLLSLGFLSCSDNEQSDGLDVSNKNSKASMSKSFNANKKNHIYTNYDEAFKAAKTENKPVFMLFSTEYCRWCIKLKETTLKHPELASRLEKEYIVLFLDRDKSIYPSKYRVKGVPAIYFTDKNEQIFTSIVGYHKNSQDYIKWLNYIEIELGQ